jgi:hypothetical protein
MSQYFTQGAWKRKTRNEYKMLVGKSLGDNI